MTAKINPKQVIVMRKFKNMRIGKYCAQASHASVKALMPLDGLKSEAELEWISGRYKKVVCYVETEEEILDIYNLAKLMNVRTALVTDKGLTEFHGVPTITCVAVGPDRPEEIDKITSDLPLF